MSDLKRVGEIEVSQDLDFQRAEWKVQRVGWAVLVLIALASLTGALGGGRLAERRQSTPAGELIVDYERIVRHMAPTRFELHFPKAQGEVGVAFSNEYLLKGELRAIVPEPSKTESGAGSTTFFFMLQPDASVSFTFDPDQIGPRTIELRLRGGPALQLKQFVLP